MYSRGRVIFKSLLWALLDTELTIEAKPKLKLHQLMVAKSCSIFIVAFPKFLSIYPVKTESLWRILLVRSSTELAGP